jgi:hypothetical protein
MARSAELTKSTEKPEEAVAKLQGVFERHMLNLPSSEQERRWKALEKYAKKFTADDGDPAKR